MNIKLTSRIYARVSVRGAFDVATFLDRMIPTNCPIPNVKEWEEVRDALYALANDTDAIVSYQEDEESADEVEITS